MYSVLPLVSSGTGAVCAGQVGKAIEGFAYFGNGSLQFPLCLLHAEASIREEFPLHSSFGYAFFRGNHTPGHGFLYQWEWKKSV